MVTKKAGDTRVPIYASNDPTKSRYSSQPVEDPFYGRALSYYTETSPAASYTELDYSSKSDEQLYEQRPALINHSSMGSLESWRSLPVIEHLTPPKKDLPVYLNGQYFRACADFGAGVNVIDAKVAHKLDLKVVLDSSCVPLELPTFGKTIKPIGRATVQCEFPLEPDSQAQHQFFVFRNFV